MKDFRVIESILRLSQEHSEITRVTLEKINMALYQFRPDSLFFFVNLLVPLQLTTSENTITYHNALFLSLQNFA